MKKRLLTFYDKMLIAGIVGLLTMIGCGRKTYLENKLDKTEKFADTIRLDKIDIEREIIAMYGVRPTDIRELNKNEK